MRVAGRARFALGILGTIILGAIGSGLWSFVDAPFRRLGNSILTLITLGMEASRDEVYAKAAMGLHELPSLYLLLMASALLLILPWLPLFGVLWLRGLDKFANKGDPDATLKTRKKILGILLLTATALGSYMFTWFLRVNQENLIASYFKQHLTIVRPYITEGEHIGFQSAFAGMKSKREYRALMSSLQTIAKAHGVQLPDAQTW